MSLNAKDVADNVFLVLSARVMQLVGIPVGLAVAGWFALTFNHMQIAVEGLRHDVHQNYSKVDAAKDTVVVTQRIDGLDTRVSVLEYVSEGKR